MLVLKACPRCHGDLMLEATLDADYYECLQCGHVLSLAQEHVIGVQPTCDHRFVRRSRPRGPRRSPDPGRRASSKCPASSPEALALRRAFRPAYLP